MRTSKIDFLFYTSPRFHCPILTLRLQVRIRGWNLVVFARLSEDTTRKWNWTLRVFLRLSQTALLFWASNKPVIWNKNCRDCCYWRCVMGREQGIRDWGMSCFPVIWHCLSVPANYISVKLLLLFANIWLCVSFPFCNDLISSRVRTGYRIQWWSLQWDSDGDHRKLVFSFCAQRNIGPFAAGMMRVPHLT